MTGAGELIKRFLTRKKKGSPQYSLRALARDIRVSPSFLSEVLNGKKRLALDRINQLGRVLDMDLDAIAQLKRFYIPEALRDKTHMSDAKKAADGVHVPKNQFDLVKQWFYPALMDLTTCADFNGSVDEISSRLGIAKEAAEVAVRELLAAGALVEEDGRLRKAENVMKFTSRTSRAQFRQFHTLMLKKFLKDLPNHADEKEFQRNLLLGVTVAVNPDKLELAKQKLSACLMEIAETLSDGDCTEVYQLAVQLFPLTKPAGSVKVHL